MAVHNSYALQNTFRVDCRDATMHNILANYPESVQVQPAAQQHKGIKDWILV